MRRLAFSAASCCLAALLPLLPASAGDAPAPAPEPGVTITQLEGLTILEAVVPGHILDYALPRTGDGKRNE